MAGDHRPNISAAAPRDSLASFHGFAAIDAGVDITALRLVIFSS
jgi:hypothetical protein